MLPEQRSFVASGAHGGRIFILAVLPPIDFPVRQNEAASLHPYSTSNSYVEAVRPVPGKMKRGVLMK